MRALPIIICLGALAGAGCRTEPRAAGPAVADYKPEMSTSWQSAAVPSNAQPMPVKEGAAPLVYRVEGGATIRVHEQSANRDLARSFVPGGSLVRVDGRRGVVFGDDTVFAGPLPEGARYVIYVEPTGENVARQGLIQPRPRDAR